MPELGSLPRLQGVDWVTMTAQPAGPRSAADYLEIERASSRKHAFLDGEIFDMAGGTHEHSLIASNFVGEFRAGLKTLPCVAHGSDLRIFIPRTGLYTYSDALIVCGEPSFTDDARDTITNPVVIVEVLSDSSEAYDRGEKFMHYRSIPTLCDYVLASQKGVLVEHFARDGEGNWVLRALGPGGRLELTARPLRLEVDDLYVKVFPTPTGT